MTKEGGDILRDPWSFPSKTGGDRLFQAGLLAPGSSYSPRLPVTHDSGLMWVSSPDTAAGPLPIFTGFPF